MEQIGFSDGSSNDSGSGGVDGGGDGDGSSPEVTFVGSSAGSSGVRGITHGGGSGTEGGAGSGNGGEGGRGDSNKRGRIDQVSGHDFGNCHLLATFVHQLRSITSRICKLLYNRHILVAHVPGVPGRLQSTVNTSTQHCFTKCQVYGSVDYRYLAGLQQYE